MVIPCRIEGAVTCVESESICLPPGRELWLVKEMGWLGRYVDTYDVVRVGATTRLASRRLRPSALLPKP